MGTHSVQDAKTTGAPYLGSVSSVAPTIGNGWGITSGFGSIWVGIVCGPGGAASAVGVQRFAPDLTLLATITPGNYPAHEIRGVAASMSAGRVAACDMAAGAVLLIDPTTNATAATVTGLTAPRALCWGPDDALYVTESPSGVGGYLRRLDVVGASGAIPAAAITDWRAAVGATPYMPAHDGARIWVPNFSSDTVSVVNEAGGVIATRGAASGPYCAHADGASVWVTEHSAGSVARFVPSVSGNAVSRASVGGAALGAAGLIRYEDRLFVAHASGDKIGALDATTGAYLGSGAALGIHPTQCAYLDGSLYVPLSQSQAIERRIVTDQL